MKTNKSLLSILITLILFLGACQPQAATSSPAEDPSSNSIPAPEAAATSSPEATEAPQAQSSSLFAKLSELAGIVGLKQAGQSSFTPASADKSLEVNGQIQTGEDGRVRLDLSSGTIIRVAPSSLFTLKSNEEVEGGLITKIQLELGKIFIILNGGKTEVETPSGVAAVQGSYLKVEFNPTTGELTLTCLEGDCSVTTPDGQKKNFTDGQKIKVHKDATGAWVLDEGSMSPEDFQEWLEYNPEAKALVDQATEGDTGGGSGGACFDIIQPSKGSNLPVQGKIKFEWGAQPGAEKYIVKFTNASGKVVVIETTDTSFEPYIEGFLPDAGEVNWFVTAVNAAGEEICRTDVTTFSKPNSIWEPDAKNDEGGDEPKKPDPEPDPQCTDC